MQAGTISRMEKAAAFVDYLRRYEGDEESAFLEILAYVSGGGSIVDYCAEVFLSAGLLIAWIRRDAERSRRYDMACLDRKALDAEMVRGVWSGVMIKEPVGMPKYSDVLRASELMGKYAGVLHDGPVVGERDALTEGEVREQLLELLSRNPDVRLAVQGMGDVVDAELVSGVVAESEAMSEARALAPPQVPARDFAPVVPKEVPVAPVPRRAVSQEAATAKAARGKQPKSSGTEKIIEVFL